MRGQKEEFLFMGTDIYDFVEIHKTKLRQAYEALPNERALDETYASELKKQFMLDIPRLRPDEWSAEQTELPQGLEILAYVPFDGDPSVFNLRPSAMKMTVARGEIVDHDWRIRLTVSGPHIDVAAMVKRELAEVQWRLESLRSSMEHMNQQLEGQLRICIAQRKRAVENKTNISQNIGIPLRKPAGIPAQPLTSAPAIIQPKSISTPKPTSSKKRVQPTWDIFMSHASTDKPWVRGLVKALRENGVTVWFDQDSLEWGEDLQRGINRGLINCRKAIAVLSQSYLAQRKWTEAEISGLLAREKLGETLILPIWHKVTEDDMKRYNLVIASRLAKVSDSDNYGEIVRAVLKVLGRNPEVDAHSSSPIKRREGKDDRELCAFGFYEQKGPGAKRAQIYVRKSDKVPSCYVLLDNEFEYEGTEDEISILFFTTDRTLKKERYVRMNYSNPSNNRAFEI